jgi:cytidylate kinase
MATIQEIVNRQIRQWHMGREASSPTPAPAPPGSVPPAITLSRQRGSGGRALAARLAEELGYTVLDHQIIDYMARDTGVRRQALESLDEHHRAQLEIWVEGILSGRMVDQGDYFRGLGQVIRTAVHHGSVIILGRGGSFVIDDPNILRARTVAPADWRVRRIVENEGLTPAQAEEEIRRVDEERAGFVKTYFHRDVGHPLGYDLVINTGTLFLEPAVRTVIAALEARVRSSGA